MTLDHHGLTDFDVSMLDEASVAQDIGVAYGLARRQFPGAEDDELHERVRRSLLALLDRNLISFFRAPIEDGYSIGPGEVAALSRDDVVADLDLGPAHIPDETEMLFFVQTQRAASD